MPCECRQAATVYHTHQLCRRVEERPGQQCSSARLHDRLRYAEAAAWIILRGIERTLEDIGWDDGQRRLYQQLTAQLRGARTDHAAKLRALNDFLSGGSNRCEHADPRFYRGHAGDVTTSQPCSRQHPNVDCTAPAFPMPPGGGGRR